LPELESRLGSLTPRYTLPPEQARLRLYEAVGSFLAAIAADSPLVLILDDLQWADSATADLLVHVARRQVHAPLLLLGAYRWGEETQNAGLERAIDQLNRLRLLTPLELKPLSQAELAALLEAHVGARVDDDVSGLLYEQSDGNPFFAEELLRGWYEIGALTGAGEHWNRERAERLEPPSTIVNAVRRRLARLSPLVVEQLEVAAIAGRSFDADTLAAAQGLSLESVEELLLEGYRAGLIRTLDDRQFEFTHDKVRESIYAQVSVLRRRKLHEALGRVLETQPRRRSAQHLASLAFHFTRSGDRDKGVDYACQAAELALHTYAGEEAVSHYETALQLLPADDARRGWVLLALGEAALVGDSEKQAISAFEEAQSRLLAEGDTVSAARAARGAGTAHCRLQELWLARQSLETALVLLGDDPHPLTVDVLIDLANLLGSVQLQLTDGLRFGRQAVEMARKLGNAALEASASGIVGYLLITANDRQEGLVLLERAIALSLESNRLADAAEYCAYLANAHYWRAQLDRAREWTERRLEYARRCHETHHIVNAHSFLAFLHVHRGEWAGAESMLARTRVLSQSLASPMPGAFILQIRALMAFHRGDYRLAGDWLQQSVSSLTESGNGVLVWLQSQLGVTRAAQAERAETLALMEKLETALSTLQTNLVATGAALTCLSLMALSLGEWKRATSYHSRLCAHEQLFEYFLTDRVLGTIETWQGDLEAAEGHLARAEETARREGLWPELPRVLVARSELALVQGTSERLERAEELLRAAADLFGARQMTAELGRARRRLRELRKLSADRTGIGRPWSLTADELEVLRLVARGWPNKQVATELGLSVRTVGSRLRSLASKTGVESRAALVAFAFQNGLVTPG
ncbi:MAG: LuxR C-terminal-related transcriptional regulator, partial [Chloroflexota bacterium]|nr:LuxR C-terminal-related transcriptional regulator [Chloroflexota bacterium]